MAAIHAPFTLIHQQIFFLYATVHIPVWSSVTCSSIVFNRVRFKTTSDWVILVDSIAIHNRIIIANHHVIVHINWSQVTSELVNTFRNNPRSRRYCWWPLWPSRTLLSINFWCAMMQYSNSSGWACEVQTDWNKVRSRLSGAIRNYLHHRRRMWSLWPSRAPLPMDVMHHWREHIYCNDNT